MPSAALTVAGANGSTYRLQLNLSPPAAGGEALRVSIAPDTLYGSSTNFAVPACSYTGTLADLRPPTIRVATLTPTEFAPEGHALKYTIGVNFTEPVFAAIGGGPVLPSHFTVSVGGQSVTVNSEGVFDVQPSSGSRRALNNGHADGAAQMVTLPTTPPQSARYLTGPRGRRLNSGLELRLSLSPDLMPSEGTSVVVTPIQSAIIDAAGNIQVASPVAAGRVQPFSGASAPPNPPSGNATAPPPFRPGMAPTDVGGITQDMDAAAAAGVTAGAIMGAFAFLCCLAIVYICYRRNKRKKRTTVEQLDALLNKDGANQEMTGTLKDILSQVREGVSLQQATDEVVADVSVLPPKLANALEREWFARHNNDPHADPPNDAEKLDLLKDMLRGPSKPATPVAILKPAYEDFEKVYLRPATSEHEALLHLKGVLDLAAPGLAKLMEMGLVDAVEDTYDVRKGFRGGGGVRLRPPHLKPSRGDDYYVAPKMPEYNPNEGLDTGNLPLAVLESATALFGNVTSPLMRDGASDGIVESLGSLKQRLDRILDTGKGAISQEESDAADGAGELPPGVVEQAKILFLTRNGKPPMNDLEALSMLRDRLNEAGITSGGRKTRWLEMISNLAAPPPPMFHPDELPPSVMGVAAELIGSEFENMPPEMREQRELQELQKVVQKVLELKLPPLVLSMARAEFEKDEGRGAFSDIEAIEKLLDELADAGISDVDPGWDGGGGAKVFAPRLKPPPPSGENTAWQDLPPPPAQVDLDRLPEVAVRAAEALGSELVHADPQVKMLMLRDRLREFAEGMLSEEVMQDMRVDFRDLKGKAASSDREVVAELGKWIEKATVADIARGSDGGGGVRVAVPKLKPAPPKRPATEMPDDAPRPLQLGTLPLGIITAVAPLGGKGSAAPLSSLLGSAPRDEPTLMYDASNLTPQLGQLLTRVDKALDSEDDLALRNLPKPVRDAAASVFLARRGYRPDNDRAALQEMRSVLEEGGVQREENEDDVIVIRPPGSPRQVPDFILQAARELAAGDASGGEESEEGSSAMQLFKLQEVLEAVTEPDGARGGKPDLPDDVAIALQAEFGRRVGGEDDASPLELLQLAKQVVSEAEDAQRMRQFNIEVRTNSRENSGRASFGATKQMSRKGLFAGLKLPNLGVELGGGFSHFVQTSDPVDQGLGDSVKEDQRGSLNIARKSCCGGRGSLAEKSRNVAPRLIERDISLQHLCSRKQEIQAKVRNTVGSLGSEPIKEKEIETTSQPLLERSSGSSRGRSNRSSRNFSQRSDASSRLRRMARARVLAPLHLSRGMIGDGRIYPTSARSSRSLSYGDASAGGSNYSSKHASGRDSPEPEPVMSSTGPPPNVLAELVRAASTASVAPQRPAPVLPMRPPPPQKRASPANAPYLLVNPSEQGSTKRFPKLPMDQPADLNLLQANGFNVVRSADE